MEQVFYLFYNSVSGGNRGQQFVQYDQQDLTFETKPKNARVKFFNIYELASRNKGFDQIKQQQQNDTYIVMAGGDGSIMWIVGLLLQYQIDLNRCIIIPFPFGTGNDFANSLGWGTTVPADVIGKNNKVLQNYVEQWLIGAESFFDVWDVDIVLKKDGFISEIKRHSNSVGELKIQLKDCKFNKPMINYFSIGVDARIGYGFDKNRTAYQCCNKVVYCWEGFKKMFLKTPKMNQSIETLEYLDDNDDMQNKLLFKTQENAGQRDSITIPGNPINLLCLNINSYAGGLKNIWMNAQYEEGYKKYDFHPPSFSDGVLEFLSFNSILGIGSERILPGQATRLSQTKGPIKLNFKKNEPLRTYFQIDGQYYSITNPISVSIRSCQQLSHGKIRVLINKQGIVQ
ncbi:unnamed protein product [Paramecium octaurelia]|uniref:DAGKc domain-containing protein n=1 Tax=Paramecium octaurelia TaxID=43137 RepID=A0A8S1V1G5_PAROT|nr:unnamed protein product [Paramecium octaurelia]